MAVRSLQQSLAMWQELGSQRGYTSTLGVLGYAVLLQGQALEAGHYFAIS